MLRVTKRVRYARYGEAEREHVLTVVYQEAGEMEGCKWEAAGPGWMNEEQDRVPPGSTHPVVTGLLADMLPVPEGHEVHPFRRGLMTGTVAAAAVGKSRWAERDAARDGFSNGYALAVARAAGRAPPVRQNADMTRGKNEEPEALTLVEKVFGLELVRDRRMGLLIHPGGEVGASLDGVFRRIPYGVEIKSKATKTTLGVPVEHYYQIQTQFIATADAAGTPRLQGILYVQYVSHLPSGFPLLNVALVRPDKEVMCEIFRAAHPYISDIRRAGVPAPPVPVRGERKEDAKECEGTVERGQAAAAAGRGGRAPVRAMRRYGVREGRAFRGGWRGGAGRPYPPAGYRPRKKAVTRMRRVPRA